MQIPISVAQVWQRKGLVRSQRRQIKTTMQRLTIISKRHWSIEVDPGAYLSRKLEFTRLRLAKFFSGSRTLAVSHEP
jgi:hypothetical protein